MNTVRTIKGRQAEDLAYEFLTQQGLTLLTRNYRCRMGEIDLIMREGNITVFVEVRSRGNNRFMDTVESIDSGKRAHIIATSQDYLQNQKRADKDVCRYDIVLLTGPAGSEQIEWLKNAFEA